MSTPDHRVAALLRELAPQVLGAMVRRDRDFDAADDATQDALIAAASQWPTDGIPDAPRAWLVRVASRRLTDQARGEMARRRREDIVASLVPIERQIALAADEDTSRLRDDTLALLFACCHPALTTASAIALMLRAVGGLTTAEIARAFLVPEAVMAQRITRAKATIRQSGVPLELPSADEAGARLGAVLHVLYLVFNEGYAATAGADVMRADLSLEALRLTRLLHTLLPDDGGVAGLLALMLLTEARSAARTGPLGELVPLDEQDRSLWDRDAIAEGVALVTATLSRGSIGAYQLQAAIAAVHDEASSAAETDWADILGLYGMLMRISDNPMVALNHAVAVAMVRGPEAGLVELDALASDARLRDHHRVDAVRAHLLERAGELDRAVPLYRRAADRTASQAERDYLLVRAARVAGAVRSSDR